MKYDEKKVIENPRKLPDGEYYMHAHKSCIKYLADRVGNDEYLVSSRSNIMYFSDGSNVDIKTRDIYHPANEETYKKCLDAGLYEIKEKKTKEQNVKDLRELLKDGMIVTGRNGVKCVYFGGTLRRETLQGGMGMYKEDLTCSTSQFDIMKIEHSTGDLVWEREEYEEVTAMDIAKRLFDGEEIYAKRNCLDNAYTFPQLVTTVEVSASMMVVHGREDEYIGDDSDTFLIKKQ